MCSAIASRTASETLIPSTRATASSSSACAADKRKVMFFWSAVAAHLRYQDTTVAAGRPPGSTPSIEKTDLSSTPRSRDIATPLPVRDLDAEDGALMEQSGGKQWQPVANRSGLKTAQTSQNRCRRLPPVADRSAW
jgi:hypothetical protein